MRAVKGIYYEFHKERIVSRPGAPVVTREGMGMGPPITLKRDETRVRWQ